MQEFIAGIINGWPIWIILIVGLIGWAAWIWFEITIGKAPKKTWWQDEAKSKKKLKKGN